MINEERVKQLYKLAIYEKNEEKKHRDAGLYYRKEYVMKEIIKSFFTGTFAYALLILIWGVSSWGYIIDKINSYKVAEIVIPAILFYIGFMGVYLFVTFVIYVSRYARSAKKVAEYKKDLKTMHQMYEREEKLKM